MLPFAGGTPVAASLVTVKTTKKQAPTQFQSIDTNQLDAVLGGCACGCGQATCTCAGGSCGQATAAQPPQPTWAR